MPEKKKEKRSYVFPLSILPAPRPPSKGSMPDMTAEKGKRKGKRGGQVRRCCASAGSEREKKEKGSSTWTLPYLPPGLRGRTHQHPPEGKKGKSFSVRSGACASTEEGKREREEKICRFWSIERVREEREKEKEKVRGLYARASLLSLAGPRSRKESIYPYNPPLREREGRKGREKLEAL